MSNYNQDSRELAEQANQATDGTGEQEFTYTEERKPINRNMVVLLLIAVVGSSLVYLMYVRGRFNADTQIPELSASNAAVSEQISGANQDLKTLEQQLKKTEDAVRIFQAPNSSGQIEASELKTNPFAFPQAGPKQGEAAPPLPVAVSAADPKGNIQLAASKVKVQMILYANSGSTAQINTGIYRKGDRFTVDDVSFTVAEITRDEVVLRSGGDDYRVRLAGKQGL